MNSELLDDDKNNREPGFEFQGEFVRVKTFIELMDAYMLRARFEGEGIRCYIKNENLIMMDPLYSNAVGGAQLWVFHSQLPAALEIIEEIENQPYTDESGKAIECPDCFSTKLVAGHKSYKGIGGFFSMLFALLTATYPVYSKNVFKCQDCGKSFEGTKN